MRIAYCDDETVQAVYVKECLQQWEQQTGERCELNVYGSAKELLFELLDGCTFDLLLLDIEMSQMNGIELARKIREADSRVMIVFLTNKKEYVFEGYEVQAFRYLLKPLKYEAFQPVLQQMIEYQKVEQPYFILNTGREKRKIYQEEIYYIEVAGHYVKLVTKDENIEWKQSLSNILKELDPLQFVITHRSFVVNLDYVIQIKRTECILENDVIVPISRTYYKNLNEAFIQHYRK